MSRIFLGRWWHWANLIAAVLALWLTGEHRMHVIHFNPFILSLLGATAVVVAIVIAKIRPGEQVTRDPLEAPGQRPTDEETGA